MPENQNTNGEHWTKESVAIFNQLGWTQKGTTNFDIECSLHPNRKGQGHGIDSLFTYYDPYTQSEQGILVESKCWQFRNITAANIKKWFKQITECIECIQVSPSIQDLTSAPIKNAILMCWANDEFEHEEFQKRLRAVKIRSKRYECNLFVASNHEILKWCSLINTINKLKMESKDFKFLYPNVPTLGTNLVKANHISLIHLYSKYIFAQAKVVIPTYNGGTEIKDQLIVFSFEKTTMASLEFMYDMIKQLNLQDAHEYVFYLYERETAVRQIVGEFTTRVNQQISGDISNPSNVIIKYLDILEGLTYVPDNIINLLEVKKP